MSSKKRTIEYSLAINEALQQMMRADPSVFLIGQGVKSPWYVGRTTQELLHDFGPERVIDTPVSENAMTGAAVGAAIAGMRPIVVHPRMDFMLYAFDPIINEAANWHYMCGGRSSVPVVIWGIVNRGGEQAAQHSQAFHGLFTHIPGLKVVMPSTSYDAKGLLIAAIQDDNPVLYIEDRWLHEEKGPAPKETYTVEIGKGKIMRRGKDITLVSISYMMRESLKAAEELASSGIDVELIDLRTAKPIDKRLLLNSIKKTGRMVIADGGWKTSGLTAEISALAADEGFKYLKSPIKRVALPDTPAPASAVLERVFYQDHTDIIRMIKKIFRGKQKGGS
jgi:pyruvate dehydrogenase E1 component beta subunit